MRKNYDTSSRTMKKKYDASRCEPTPLPQPTKHRRAFRVRFKVIACTAGWSLLHSVAFDSCFSGLGYDGKWVDTIIHIIDRDWTRFSVTNEEMPSLKKTRRHWCAIKCTVLSLMMVEASPHSGSGHREPARAFAPPILHPPLLCHRAELDTQWMCESNVIVMPLYVAR